MGDPRFHGDKLTPYDLGGNGWDGDVREFAVRFLEKLEEDLWEVESIPHEEEKSSKESAKLERRNSKVRSQ